MYRGNFMPGGGASPEKLMRQQYHSSPHHHQQAQSGHLNDAAAAGVGGHNDEGLMSTHLQDQYDTNEMMGQHAMKRQRLLGGGDAVTMMGSPQNHHLQDRARMLQYHQGAAGAGAGAGGGGAMGGPPPHGHGGGMNMNMNMPPGAAGHQPPPGMENDLAAAIYRNDFNGGHGGGGGGGFPGAAAAAGFGSFGGNFGPASGLIPPGAGNPFVGDYGRLSQLRGPGAAAAAFGGFGGGFNPYDQGMNMNMNPMGGMNMNMNMNPMAGMNMNMNMPQTGAMAGLPSAANRRAQIMALMDMENELQQQEAAAQVKAFPGRQGAGAAAAAAAAAGGMSHLRSPMSGFTGGPTSRMGALPSSTTNGGSNMREPQDPDGVTQPLSEGGDRPVASFSTQATPAPQTLPPIMEEGAAAHYSQRTHIPLGIDEDNNWLTEFQCFIRYDLIEVVQASRHVDPSQKNNESDAGDDKNKEKIFHQIGIRCRYCAHLHPGQRASRSSAFPSSIRQLYQSFTMMLRDHFESCPEILKDRKRLFSELKSKNSQGAYDSKQYWVYAAEKLGMIDSEHGIQMTLESQAKARRMPPFGTCGENSPSTQGAPKLLVAPEDLRIASDFLYTLMSQVQVVHLIDSERVGKRKTLRVGLPGFGCRYCCHVGRCGLSRMFPLRRRMLPGKVNEIYEHFKRCTLIPAKEKELLQRLKREDRATPEQEKEFFDRVWERLGCESEIQK